ncbi:MAG TPA: NAD-dependent epimerase/dehydratase family protein [Anaerolineaceae bacterium]|nr:NAD-dependent epimerase/dehydratase family protein [Anaerolineaceae bacterium]
MKIFITGGTGFIGQHTLRRLAQTDHQVVCLVRPGSEPKLLNSRLMRPWPNLQIVNGDVTDPAALAAGMQGCDALIHLANLYSMWLQETSEFERVNVTGTRNVMTAAADAGLKKVVYVSTVAVYGQPAERVFTEESARGPRQFSHYGRTKTEGERIAWELHRTRGLPLTALYPGIVLGAGDDKPSGVYIHDFIAGRIPTPIFRRSVETYVHVNDTAEAVLQALERPKTVGQKYLIGNTRLNGMDYARLICQAAGVKMPWMRLPDVIVMAAAYLLTWQAQLFTHQPPPWGLSIDAAWTLLHGFAYDGSKAERELGLRYTPVLEALKDAVAWYRGEFKLQAPNPKS